MCRVKGLKIFHFQMCSGVSLLCKYHISKSTFRNSNSQLCMLTLGLITPTPYRNMTAEMLNCPRNFIAPQHTQFGFLIA